MFMINFTVFTFFSLTMGIDLCSGKLKNHFGDLVFDKFSFRYKKDFAGIFHTDSVI